MKALLQWKLITLPDDVCDGESIEEWKNCLYVFNHKTRVGRIYFKNLTEWKLVASNVRSYTVNRYGYNMPNYLNEYGYAFFTTTDKFGNNLLDCITGKVIFQGNFQIKSAIEGMHRNHEDSCFIFKQTVDDHVEYVLTNHEGKMILGEGYVGKDKKVEFLTYKAFGGIRPILFSDKKKGKVGLLHYFKGECIQITPVKYDSISILLGAIKDSKGKLHYPTYKATYTYQNKKFEKYFDMNGREVKISKNVCNGDGESCTLF